MRGLECPFCIPDLDGETFSSLSLLQAPPFKNPYLPFSWQRLRGKSSMTHGGVDYEEVVLQRTLTRTSLFRLLASASRRVNIKVTSLPLQDLPLIRVTANVMARPSIRPFINSSIDDIGQARNLLMPSVGFKHPFLSRYSVGSLHHITRRGTMDIRAL